MRQMETTEVMVLAVDYLHSGIYMHFEGEGFGLFMGGEGPT